MYMVIGVCFLMKLWYIPAQADLGATAQPGSAAATASAALQALPENIQDRPLLLSITHHDDVVVQLIVVIVCQLSVITVDV